MDHEKEFLQVAAYFLQCRYLALHHRSLGEPLGVLLGEVDWVSEMWLILANKRRKLDPNGLRTSKHTQPSRLKYGFPRTRRLRLHFRGQGSGLLRPRAKNAFKRAFQQMCGV